MNWIAGFVHPALLAGLGLASVPVIIHLLNRRRHKPMPWAAMRFVLAAHKKTRRRVQMENLLLLLLRVAAVALLALAIARPFTGRESPLAGLTETRRDLLLVIDASASTGYRETVDTVFDREVARAREIVRGLEGSRGDRVRLVLGGGTPKLLAWTTPDQAMSVLDTLDEPSDEPLDLASALDEALRAQDEAAVAAGSALEVRLLTDLQRRSFLADDTARDANAPGAPPALFEVLGKLHERQIRVVVEDLGPRETTPANLAIGNVAPEGRLEGPGWPADVRVDVWNFGASARSGVRVVLEVDSERRPNQTIDVPARGKAQAVFSVVFKDAGDHVLVGKLEEGDALAFDNQRAHVVAVPAAVRVLLVNGASGAVIDEDEVGYLKAVLEPPVDDGMLAGAGHAPFEPSVIEPGELSANELDLQAFDVVWLANVESLAAASVERLEAFVGGGKALVVSLGDRVDLESWNQRAFRADGTGLLPASLDRVEAVPSRAESYWRVVEFARDHPALAFFADERFQPLLSEVPVYAFTAVTPLANARVLAELDDAGRRPLLVERAYDKGRVYLWTTSIDGAWTRLPESPATLIPLVHEWLRDAATEPAPPRNVPPGAQLAASARVFPRNLVLVRPDDTRRGIDSPAVQDASHAGRWRLPVVPAGEAARVGVWRFEMDNAAPIAFAVQPDAREGDLERLSPAALAGLHPALQPADVEESTGSDAERAAPARGELWRGIAIACLVALVLESLWAAWLGQKRTVRA